METDQSADDGTPPDSQEQRSPGAADRFVCPKCQWSGSFAEVRQDFFDEMWITSCPRCSEVLALR